MVNTKVSIRESFIEWVILLQGVPSIIIEPFLVASIGDKICVITSEETNAASSTMIKSAENPLIKSFEHGKETILLLFDSSRMSSEFFVTLLLRIQLLLMKFFTFSIKRSDYLLQGEIISVKVLGLQKAK